MIRRPPRSTRTDTLFPYTTLFRSAEFPYDLPLAVSKAIKPCFDQSKQSISTAFGVDEPRVLERHLDSRGRAYHVASQTTPAAPTARARPERDHGHPSRHRDHPRCSEERRFLRQIGRAHV